MAADSDFTQADRKALELSINDLLSAEFNLAGDELVAIVHGHRGESRQKAALDIIRAGFKIKIFGSAFSQRKSFIAACIKRGNTSLALQMAQAGPPATVGGKPWTPPRSPSKQATGRPPVGAGQSAHARWLDFLCSYEYEASRSRLVDESDIYGTLLATLGEVLMAEEASPLIQLLRLAYTLEPNHPCYEQPTVPPSLKTQLPGNFHNALVHAALFGPLTLESAVIAARSTVSAKAVLTPLALTVHESAMAMLRCLHEMKAPRPTRMDGLPMDALPFAVASNVPTSRDPHEVLVSLLRRYVDAGWVDLDARFDGFHADTRDCFPLDVALWAGGPAAAAFIDAGCNLDNPALVANQSDLGLVETAMHHSTRPETGPMVAAAVMRRRVGSNEGEKRAGEARVVRRRAVL